MWTCPPSRIVVAVDFGAPALAAVRLAAPLVRRLGATLRAVHAETLEAPPYFTTEQIATLEAQRTSARLAAERELRRVIGRETDVPVETVVVAGPATEVLLEATADADLIVVGTHGRRGPSRWWLGSVAERIARSSPIPVLIVHDVSPPAELFAEILVVNGSHGAGRAGRCADRLAALAGGRVRHVTADEAAADAQAGGVTALVIPRRTDGPAPELTSAGATLIRDCRLPLLFIPEDPS